MPVLALKPTPRGQIAFSSFVFFSLSRCADSAQQCCFPWLLSFFSAFALRQPRRAKYLSPAFVFVIRFRFAPTPPSTVPFSGFCLFFRFCLAVTLPDKTTFPGLCFLFSLWLCADSAQQNYFLPRCLFYLFSLGSNSAGQNRLCLPINFLKFDPTMRLLSRRFSHRPNAPPITRLAR